MNKKKLGVLINPKSYNDATFYYIELVKKCFTIKDYEVIESQNIKDLKFCDILFTITLKDYLKTIKYPFKKKIYWFQGIKPEENYMYEPNKIKFFILSLLEFFVLHTTHLNIFVSINMLNHYVGKYKYRKNNYQIIPCYNQTLNDESFEFKDKYKLPSFVYAGSLSKWQCIDEMLASYKLIEEVLHNASLTILTNDISNAKKIVDNYKLKKYSIKYVEPNDLNKELIKYKYGFILRKKDPVNDVATPTKMNTYMANGIIPIIANIFQNISVFNNEFIINTKNINPNDILLQILKYENKEIISSEIKKQYSEIFEAYYNSKTYTMQLLLSIDKLYIK